MPKGHHCWNPSQLARLRILAHLSSGQTLFLSVLYRMDQKHPLAIYKSITAPCGGVWFMFRTVNMIAFLVCYYGDAMDSPTPSI